MYVNVNKDTLVTGLLVQVTTAVAQAVRCTVSNFQQHNKVLFLLFQEKIIVSDIDDFKPIKCTVKFIYLTRFY